MVAKYLIQKTQIIIFTALSLCALSCNPILRRENIYEVLIFQTCDKSSTADAGKDEFYESNTKINMIAMEYDKKRILQQNYCDNVYSTNNGFYIAGRNILKDGLPRHKKSLRDPHNCFILKIDFDRFRYRDYNIDLTKGSNYIFLSGRIAPSWTLDNISLHKLMEHFIILIESNYSAKLNDSICIPHASRLIRANRSSRYGNSLVKHVIIYDRDKQLIVAAEHRDYQTNELLSKYELIKVIKLTGEEFYEFWTGEDN